MRIFAIFSASSRLCTFRAPLFLFVLFSGFLWNADLHGVDTRAQKRVAVLVSRDIRPYVEAVGGMSAVLADSANIRMEVHSLEKIKGKSRDLLKETLTGEKVALLVAVGPEAVHFASEGSGIGKIAWLYSMVLNPPGGSEKAAAVCGVPLDIPAQKQLEMIVRGLPSAKRIGLLYDPRYNADFLGKAIPEAAALNLKVVPLKVSSKKEIPAVLNQNWGNIDALWFIPDQTVISESIVQYIIKEALFKRTPVIGYNRFFYESGAALAFVFDYAEIGRQTGHLAASVLAGKACEQEIPLFHVWQNLRVINKLGMSVPEKRVAPIEAGP